MGSRVGAQGGRGLVGSARTRKGAPGPHAELVRSCPQWSRGTSSGQSCPGGPTTCRTCRRHSGHDSRRRTSDSGASIAPARPPASRPRPSHPRSDKAVLPTHVSVSP